MFDLEIEMRQNVTYGCLHNAMSLLPQRIEWTVLISEAFSAWRLSELLWWQHLRSGD
jgi:hypothetical protein